MILRLGFCFRLLVWWWCSGGAWWRMFLLVFLFALLVCSGCYLHGCCVFVAVGWLVLVFRLVGWLYGVYCVLRFVQLRFICFGIVYCGVQASLAVSRYLVGWLDTFVVAFCFW